MSNCQEKYIKAKESPYFKSMTAILEVVDNICQIMADKNISKKDLAAKMDVSASYISKVLRGNENLSMETIAKFAVALSCDLKSPVIFDPIKEYSGNVYSFERINTKSKTKKQTIITEKTNDALSVAYKPLDGGEVVSC